MKKKEGCSGDQQEPNGHPSGNSISFHSQFAILTIFKRFYFLYQKAEDIARELNINPATVRTKLHRGRARLKEYLEERGYECEISDC